MLPASSPRLAVIPCAMFESLPELQSASAPLARHAQGPMRSRRRQQALAGARTPSLRWQRGTCCGCTGRRQPGIQALPYQRAYKNDMCWAVVNLLGSCGFAGKCPVGEPAQSRTRQAQWRAAAQKALVSGCWLPIARSSLFRNSHKHSVWANKDAFLQACCGPHALSAHGRTSCCSRSVSLPACSLLQLSNVDRSALQGCLPARVGKVLNELSRVLQVHLRRHCLSASCRLLLIGQHGL